MKLEIGCGGNEDFPYLTRGDINIDIQKPREHVPNFVLADAHELPLRSHTFDEVEASHIIEHLDCPKHSLSEWNRVLKKGGTVVVETPNALFLLKFLRAAKKGIYAVHKDHIFTFGYPELKQLLESAGFEDIIIEYTTTRKSAQKRIEKLLLKFFFAFSAIRNENMTAIAKKPRSP